MKMNTKQLEYDNWQSKENTFFREKIYPKLLTEGKWSGDMDKELYHSSPGISSSNIRDFMENPFHIKCKKNHPEMYEDKPCFKIGRLFHEVILEGASYDSDKGICDTLVAAGAKSPRLKKEYTTWKKSIEMEGGNVVKHEEAVMLEYWLESARKVPQMDKIFGDTTAQFESTHYCVDPDTGLVLKFSPDIFSKKHKMIFDAKFCSGRENWSREVERYRYDIQAAFYCHCANIIFGEGFELFPFIHYTKKPCFKINLKMIGDEQREDAAETVPAELARMRQCYEKDDWGSIFDPVVEYSKKWDGGYIGDADNGGLYE